MNRQASIASRRHRWWLPATIVAVLAVLVLGANVVGTKSAEAALPAHTLSLSQSPAAGTSVLPGTLVTYTAVLVTTGNNTSGPVVIQINLPSGFQNATSLVVSCPAAAVGGAGITWAAGGAGTATLTCTSSAALTASITGTNGTMVVTANVGDGPTTGTASATAKDNDAATTTATNAASVGSLNIIAPGLYHVNQSGGLSLDTLRDRDTNLIGYTHAVCLVPSIRNPHMPVDVASGGPGGITDVLGVAGHYNWRITAISGTPNIVGAEKAQGNFAFGSLPCVRWYSERAGEQDITIIDGAGSVAADWADGVANGNDVCLDDQGLSGASHLTGGICEDLLLGANIVPPNFRPVVKEWNVLDRTVITRRGLAPINAAQATTNNLDGTSINVGTRFNAGNSTYVAAPVNLSEHVLGTHTTATAIFVGHVVGAKVRITASGTCGDVRVNQTAAGAAAGTTLENVTATLTPGQVTNVTTNGGPIWIDIVVAGCTQRVNDWTRVDFQTTYPVTIGSFPTPPINEWVRINWVGPDPAAKQVFLAWAGNRIVLEHDWRLLPGDGGPLTAPTGRVDQPLGTCAIDGEFDQVLNTNFFIVKYVKSGGPGTFLPATDLLGVLDPFIDVLSPDEVNILVLTNPNQFTGPGDFGGILNGFTCISRALFESEDEGEVDIEAFVTGIDSLFENQTKIAFVVYYMKFEDVKVGLVTAVSKPTHNSSLAGWSDWNPGNPWDASKDVTSADWNVSRDILVRGRVRGWFRSSNPSGRAEDRSDIYNYRPADRWVMPDDWPVLAGGPADPADGSDAIGTAESFRPYYDLMIAPNNARGLFLADPAGIGFIQVAVVASVAGFTNSATTFAVSTSTNIGIGSTVAINSQLRVVTNIAAINNASGNAIGVAITLNAPLSATPAAGTGIFLFNGVPFEGPYSLIDIPGLFGTNPTLGGAALSNINQIPSQGLIRDTILRDFDVDMWDAPMPEALVSVKIRGTGFIKQVLKQDVYFVGTANSAAQIYTNPYYFSNIPGHPLIPAIVAGGGYLWDSWGVDSIGPLGQGAYNFWQAVRVGTNSAGIGDALTNSNIAELGRIQAAYGDPTIARDLVVYSDNHGEFMVAANGDFRTDLAACAANALGGGRHCKPGDSVGKGSIMATADYPDFRGKHFPVNSNTVTVNWTWGGYKDVTVEAGETPQFKYVVFHALDRDGQCYPAFTAVGQVSLHPVLTDLTTATGVNTDTANGPRETVDFLIDSGQGIIVARSGGALNLDGNRQFATGVPTFSLTLNDPSLTGIREFPVSALAAAGSTEECQAWIKVSNSLLGIVNVLVIAHNDEGDVGFDRIIDLQTTATYTLNFRWSLITWDGANNIPVADALKGTGANDAGNDIFDQVTAVYGWDAAAQSWLGYFPAGVSVPGANDLVSLKTGQAYWIAIKGPGSVTWTYATNVD